MNERSERAVGRRWLILTREERPDSDSWWWDEDDDLPRGGFHFMLTTRKRVLSVTLELGEMTVRTRHRYFQPVISAQCHLLRRDGRWAYVQAGTRTWWAWKS